MPDKKTNLISGRRLTRNVLWNLLGAAAPLLVAILAIPVLINGLGITRFGVLTITWMVVGYFSMFDLGLDRALTKLVAEKLGKGQDEEIPKLHLLELPFYLLILWLLLNAYGIVGVALAWLLRVVVDTAILFIMANRQVTTVSNFTMWSVVQGKRFCYLQYGSQ